MTTVSDSADFPLIDLSSFLLPASDPTRVPITIESLVLPTSVLSSLSPTSAQPKAYVLYNILTPAECAGLIRLADTGLSPSGEPLLVPTNDGRTQRFVSSDRGIIRSPELSEVVWQRIKDVLAEHDEQVAGILEVKKDDDGMIGKSWKMEGRWMVQGLNDVWRLIRYEKGGHFGKDIYFLYFSPASYYSSFIHVDGLTLLNWTGPHRDGVLATDVNHRSMKTFMFYLNGDFEGGTTNFIDDQSLYEDEVTSKIRARVCI